MGIQKITSYLLARWKANSMICFILINGLPKKKEKFIEEKAKVRAEERNKRLLSSRLSKIRLIQKSKKIYESFKISFRRKQKFDRGFRGKIRYARTEIGSAVEAAAKRGRVQKVSCTEIDKGSKPISELEAKRGEHKKLAAAMLLIKLMLFPAEIYALRPRKV